MRDYMSLPLSGRCWWTALVALIVLLAACTSSSTGGESATEPLPTASVAAPPVAPATEGQESQSATVSPVPASPIAGLDEGTAGSATPTAGPNAGSAGTATPTSGSASAEDSPESSDNPTGLMRATLRGDLVGITEKMVSSGNKSFIPVLMEIMRFVPAYDPTFCVVCSINKLLEGPDNDLVPPERLDWGWWIEWLGNHPEVQPPDGFAGWKGELYSGIDSNFREFFYDGVKTRIRLEEVAWGGVKKDGIPDLINPPVIPAGQATYLEDSDRVFGVSINGEHRAYPLRILNPHEMANDVVGGVPFALAY